MTTNQNIKRKLGRMDQAYSLADPYSSLEIRPVVSNGAVSGFDPISAVYCPSTEKIYCGNSGSYIYALNPNKTDSSNASSASTLHEDVYQYSITSQYDSEYIPGADSGNGGMHKIASFTNPGHAGVIELKFALSKEGGGYYYGYKITKNNGSSTLFLSNVVKEGCYNENIDNGKLPHFNKNYNSKPSTINDLESKWPYDVSIEVDESDTVEVWVGGAMASCAAGGSSTAENGSIKFSNFSAQALYKGSLEECIVKRGDTRVRKDYISDYYSDFGLKNKYYNDGVYSPINDSIYYAHAIKEGSDSTGKTYNGGFGIAKINPHTNMLEHDIPLFNFDPVTGEHFSMIGNTYDRSSGLLGEKPTNILPLPKKLIYCPSNNKIYVLHGDPITSWISVINPTTDRLLGSFTSDEFKNSSDIEYCPINDKIYVANAGSDVISVIDPHADSGAATTSVSLARLFSRDGFTHLLLHYDGNFDDDAKVSASGRATLTDGSLIEDTETRRSDQNSATDFSESIEYEEYFESNITKQTTEKHPYIPVSERGDGRYEKRWAEKDFNKRVYNRQYTIFDGASCQKIPYKKEWGLTEDEFTVEFWIKPDGNYFQTKPVYDSELGISTYRTYDGSSQLTTAEEEGDDSSMLLFSFGNVHNRLSEGTQSFNDGAFGLVLNQGRTYNDAERGKLSIIRKSEATTQSFSWQRSDDSSASSGNATQLSYFGQDYGSVNCVFSAANNWNCPYPSVSALWQSEMFNPTDGTGDLRPWVKFDFDNEKEFDKLEILTPGTNMQSDDGHPSQGSHGYDGDILIEISTDGANWTLVDRWTVEKRKENRAIWWQGIWGNTVWYTYQFNTPTSGKHIRLTWDEPDKWMQVNNAPSYGQSFSVTLTSMGFYAKDGIVSGKKTIGPDFVNVDDHTQVHTGVKVKFNEWNHIAVVRRPKHTLSDSDFTYNSELSIYVNGLKWTTVDSNFRIDSESSPYLYLGGTSGDRQLIKIKSIDFEKDLLSLENSLPTWVKNGTALNLYSSSGQYPLGSDEFTTLYLKEVSDKKVELYSSKSDAENTTSEPPLNLQDLGSSVSESMYLSIDTPWSYIEGDKTYGKSVNWMHYAGAMNGFRFSNIARYDKNFRPSKFKNYYGKDEKTLLQINGDGSCGFRDTSLDLESVGVLNTSANTAPTMDEIVDPTSIYPEKDLKWHGASFQLPLGWSNKDMITFKDHYGDFDLNSDNFSISCEANFIRPDSLSNISSESDREAIGLNQLISLFYYESDDGKVKYEFFVSKTSNGVSGLDTQGPGLYFKQYNEGTEVVSLFKGIYSSTLANNTWNTFTLQKSRRQAQGHAAHDSDGTYTIIQNGTELATVTPTATLHPASYSSKGKVKIGRGEWNKQLAIGKVKVVDNGSTLLNLDPNIANPQNLLGHCYIDRYAAKGKGPALREMEDVEIVSLGGGFAENLTDNSWKPIKDANGNAFTGLSSYEHKPKDGLNRSAALFKGNYSTSSTNAHALRFKSSGSYIKHLPVTLGDPDRQYYKNPVWGYASNDGDGPELGNNNFSIECTVMPLDFDDGTSTADVSTDMGLISFNYDTLNTSSVDWSDCPQYKFGGTRVYQGHVWNDSSSSCADSRGYGESLEAQARRIVWKTSSELINDAGYSGFTIGERHYDGSRGEPDYTPAADPWHSGASNTGKVGWEVKVNSSGYIEFNFGTMARNKISGDLNHYYDGTTRQLTSTTKIKYQSWYNINVTRIADVIYLYINGTKEAEVNVGREHVLEHPLILGLTNYSKMGLLIGKTYSDGVTNSSSTASYFKGLINEVKVRTPHGKGNHVCHPTQSPLLNKTEKSTIDSSLNLNFNSQNKDVAGSLSKKYDVNGLLLRDYEVHGRGNCADYLHLNFDNAYKNKPYETEGVPKSTPNNKSDFKTTSIEEEGKIEIRNNDREGAVRLERKNTAGLEISGSSRYDLGANFTIEGWYLDRFAERISEARQMQSDRDNWIQKVLDDQDLVLISRRDSNGGGWELTREQAMTDPEIVGWSSAAMEKEAPSLVLKIYNESGAEVLSLKSDAHAACLLPFSTPGDVDKRKYEKHFQGGSYYNGMRPEKTLISNSARCHEWSAADRNDLWGEKNGHREVDGWEHFAFQVEDSRRVTVLMNGVGIFKADISYSNFLNTNLAAREKIVIGKGGGLFVDNIAVHNEVLYKNHKKVVALPWSRENSDNQYGQGNDVPDGRRSGLPAEWQPSFAKESVHQGNIWYPARIPLLREPHLFHYNNGELYYGEGVSYDHGISFKPDQFGLENAVLLSKLNKWHGTNRYGDAFIAPNMSGYIEVVESDDFNFTEDFTVEFFFNCDTVNALPDGRRTIISKGDPNNSDHTFHISLDVSAFNPKDHFSNGKDLQLRRAQLVAEAGGVTLKALENDNNEVDAIRKDLFFYDSEDYINLPAGEIDVSEKIGHNHTHDDYLIQKYKHVMLCRHSYAGNSYLSLFVDKRLVASSFLRNPGGTHTSQTLSALTSTTYPLVIGNGYNSNGATTNNWIGNINLIKIERGTNQNLCSAHNENLFRHLLAGSSTASIDLKQNNNNNSSTWGTQTVSSTALTSQTYWNTGYMINGIERTIFWPRSRATSTGVTRVSNDSEVTKNWIFENSLEGLDSHSKNSIYPDIDSWYLQENVLGDSRSSSLGLPAGTLLFINAAERIHQPWSSAPHVHPKPYHGPKDLSTYNRTFALHPQHGEQRSWPYSGDSDVDWDFWNGFHGSTLPPQWRPGESLFVSWSYNARGCYTPPYLKSVGHFMGPLRSSTWTDQYGTHYQYGNIAHWTGVQKIGCLSNIDPVNKQDFGQHQYIEAYDFVDSWDYFDEEFSVSAWIKPSPASVQSDEPAYIFKKEYKNKDTGEEAETSLSINTPHFLSHPDSMEDAKWERSYKFYTGYKNSNTGIDSYVSLEFGAWVKVEDWQHVEVIRKLYPKEARYLYTNGKSDEDESGSGWATNPKTTEVVMSINELPDFDFEAKEGWDYLLKIEGDPNRLGWSQPICGLQSGESLTIEATLVTPRGISIPKKKIYQGPTTSNIESLEIDLFNGLVSGTETGTYRIKNLKATLVGPLEWQTLWLSTVGRVYLTNTDHPSAVINDSRKILVQKYEWDAFINGVSVRSTTPANASQSLLNGHSISMKFQGSYPFPKLENRTGLTESELKTYYNDDTTQTNYWLPKEKMLIGLNFTGYMGEFAISTKVPQFLPSDYEGPYPNSSTELYQMYAPHFANSPEKADKSVIWRDGVKEAIPSDDIKFLLTFDDLEDHSMEIDRSKPTPSRNTVLLLPFDDGSLEDRSGLGAAFLPNRSLTHWIYNQPNTTSETTNPLINNTPLSYKKWKEGWGDYTLIASSGGPGGVTIEKDTIPSASWTKDDHVLSFAGINNFAPGFNYGSILKLEGTSDINYGNLPVLSNVPKQGHAPIGPCWVRSEEDRAGPGNIGTDNVYSLEFFFKPGEYPEFDRTLQQATDGNGRPVSLPIPWPPATQNHGAIKFGEGASSYTGRATYDGHTLSDEPEMSVYRYEKVPKISGDGKTDTLGNALPDHMQKGDGFSGKGDITIIPIIGGRSGQTGLGAGFGCQHTYDSDPGGFFYVCMVIQAGVGRLALSFRGDTQSDKWMASDTGNWEGSSLHANIRILDNGPFDSPNMPIFAEDNNIGYHHVYVVRQLGHWFVYMDGKLVVYEVDPETTWEQSNMAGFGPSGTKTNIIPTNWEISPDCQDMTCTTSQRVWDYEAEWRDDYGKVEDFTSGQTAWNVKSSKILKFNGKIDGVRETSGGHSFNNGLDQENSVMGGWHWPVGSGAGMHNGRCGPGSAPIPYEVIDWDQQVAYGGLKDMTVSEIGLTRNLTSVGDANYSNSRTLMSKMRPLMALNAKGNAYFSNFDFEGIDPFWKYQTWSSAAYESNDNDSYLRLSWQQARAEWLEFAKPRPGVAAGTGTGRWYPRKLLLGHIGGSERSGPTKSLNAAAAGGGNGSPYTGLLYNDPYWYSEQDSGAPGYPTNISHVRAGGYNTATNTWLEQEQTAITKVANYQGSDGLPDSNVEVGLVEAFTTQFAMFNPITKISSDQSWWNEPLHPGSEWSTYTEIIGNGQDHTPITGFWKVQGSFIPHSAQITPTISYFDPAIGSGSGNYDGTYYSALEDSEDWDLSNENFTIEFWYKLRNWGASENLGPFGDIRSTCVIAYQGHGLTWESLGWAVELTYLKENPATFFLNSFLRSKDNTLPGLDFNAEPDTHPDWDKNVSSLISPEMRFSFILDGFKDHSDNQEKSPEYLPITLKMGTPQAGVWEHFAITRSGNVFTTFKNGKIIDRLSPDSVEYTEGSFHKGEGFYIGYENLTYDVDNRPYFILDKERVAIPKIKSPSGNTPALTIGGDTRFLNYNWLLDGNLDEIRISKDMVRYTEEFEAKQEIVPGRLENPIYLGDSVSAIAYCPPSKKLYAFSKSQDGVAYGVDIINNNSYYPISFSNSQVERVSGAYFCPINNSILLSSYDGSYKIYSFLPDSGSISKTFSVDGPGKFTYAPSVNRAYFIGAKYAYEIGH
jgi:YVTN family beta-propeller protein